MADIFSASKYFIGLTGTLLNGYASGLFYILYRTMPELMKKEGFDITVLDVGHDGLISLEELEKYLWGAAVDLRGQIDASAYKDYILPLVFFKRICDVRDEEYERYKEEGGEDYADMMIEALHICKINNLEPKRILTLHKDISSKAKLVFIECMLAGGKELCIEPPLFQQGTIDETKRYDNIFKGVWEN